MLAIDIITLFPEMLSALNFGIPGRAQNQQRLELNCWNPRDYTEDKHHTVDDKPYGGGPGMVMMVEPLSRAIQAARESKSEPAHVIYLSPQGKRLDQQGVLALTSRPRLILLAGRYEGVDERLLETEIDEEVSIGDYVLSGGELAAMVLIDAMTRLLPGALGDEQSAQQDSFTDGLLDYPHYTRPENVQGRCVPEVLLSGHHQEIARWRLKQSLWRTYKRRPDLLAQLELTQEQQTLLTEIIKEQEPSGE